MDNDFVEQNTQNGVAYNTTLVSPGENDYRSMLVQVKPPSYVIVENVHQGKGRDFRVMIGAEDDGLHLMAWKEGSDLNKDSELNLLLAGYWHGTNTEVCEWTDNGTYRSGGTPDGANWNISGWSSAWKGLFARLNDRVHRGNKVPDEERWFSERPRQNQL